MKLKRIAALLTVMLMLIGIIGTMPAFAAGLTISAKSGEIKAGESIHITVDIKSEVPIYKAEISLEYDKSVLELTAVKGAGHKSVENKVTVTDTQLSTDSKNVNNGSYIFSFKGLKSGSSELNISGFAEDKQKTKLNATAKAEVKVSGGTTTPSAADGKKITIDGKDYLLCVNPSQLEKYNGYQVAEVEYDGAKAAVLQDESKKHTLYYLVDDQNKGAFYELENGKFEIAKYIVSNSNLYLIVKDENFVNYPAGYTSKRAKFDFGEINVIGFSDEALSDFVFVYCYNNGKTGYYRYDMAEKTISRAPEMSIFVSKNNTDKSNNISGVFDKMNFSGKMFILVIGLTIVCIIVLVVLFIKRKTNYSYNVEDDLFDLEDEKEESAEK